MMCGTLIFHMRFWFPSFFFSFFFLRFVGCMPCMTMSFVLWIRNGFVLTSAASVRASPSSFCHILDFCVCESDCVELWVAAIQCAYYLPAARADTASWLDTALFQWDTALFEYRWAFVRQCLLHVQSVALHQTCSSHPWHKLAISDDLLLVRTSHESEPVAEVVESRGSSLF